MSGPMQNPGYLESDVAFDSLYRNMADRFQLPIRLAIHRTHVAYELHRLFMENMPRTAGLDFCEIGCAPGLWLIYFHQYFKYNVAGIELSGEGMQLSVANLASLKIDASLLRGDAFEMPFGERRFDVVFSHSFIEHFDNPRAVFELHDLMTKPGGTIYIGMPNLRYLNHLLFRFNDRLFGRFRELRHAHNIATADLSVFENAAKKLNWEIVHLDYAGFFIPKLFQSPEVESGAFGPGSRTGRLVARNLPRSKYTSPTICMIAKKSF